MFLDNFMHIFNIVWSYLLSQPSSVFLLVNSFFQTSSLFPSYFRVFVCEREKEIETWREGKKDGETGRQREIGLLAWAWRGAYFSSMFKSSIMASMKPPPSPETLNSGSEVKLSEG